jgi:beta-galactosidase
MFRRLPGLIPLRCGWRPALALVLLALPAGAQTPPRVRESFDRGWRFQRGDAPGAEQPGFDDAAWRRLDLPHDWSIEGPYDEQAATGGAGGYLPTGIGWYRKHFTVPAGLRGRRVTVEFDGVYQHSDVWLNGHHLGFWPYGYTSFAYDLTPFLNYGAGPNVLAVRVDNSAQPNSRWYSGSGIDRHVWVTVTDPLHLAEWGTYVTTPEVSPAWAVVRICTRVRNDRPVAAAVTLTSEVGGADGQVAGTATATATIPAGAEDEFDQAVVLAHPRLWSPETPALYRLRSRVAAAGTVVDETVTPFGVRSIVYDVDRGLLLNGAPVKLQGMCLHDDGGAVGAAVPEDVWARRLRLLQAMGCNAIRTAHNPPPPEVLDLCDRLGLLVLDEAFDEWTVRKPQLKHGYSEYFDEWYERDLTSMIRRDRNHPCIVMWSAGNEIGDQMAPGGAEVLAKLLAVFHREDPTRPVTAALDNVFTDHGRAPDAFTSELDIVGYNYVDRWGARRETYYADDRRAYPQRRFVGTEDANIYGVRGRYELPAAPAPGEPPRPPRYATAMIRLEQLWKFDRTHDYVIGDFFWTGIDYLGEARWPGKGSSSGVIDTAGFPKDGYYFFQSQWTTPPVLHLFPSWNWPGHEGQVIPVLAYTNCDTVELFLNGRSLGVKAYEFPRQGTAGGWNRYARPVVPATTADLHLSWDVPYAPGVLKAVGYRDGRQVAEAEVRTAGAAAALGLAADRDALRANGTDVASVTVTVVDANGVVVPDAADLIRFSVQGPGALIGVDNGDPASHESYQAPERHAFHGRALALVRAGTVPGEIRLTAVAEGLKPATLVLAAKAIPPGPAPLITALDP